jgi:hypothetical protein
MEIETGRSEGAGKFSGENLNLKIQRQSIYVLLVFVLLAWKTAQAEVVDTLLSFDPNVAASWTPVDFNNDGTNDFSFNFYGITTLGGSATFFLDVAGDGHNQVLTQGSSVLPLDLGTTISLTPIAGSWADASSGPNVWTQLGSSGQVVGVGAPDSGDYMSVRFAVGSDWYYGWIRFGLIPNPPPDLPPLPWPSVLEFAYETNPGAAIVTPTPEPNALSLIGVSAVLILGIKKAIKKRQKY